MSDKAFVFYTDSIECKSHVDEKTGKERYFVKGHIDSGKLDLVNDIVTKSCMEDISKQFKSRNMKLDFNHETLIGDSEIEEKIALTKIPLGKAISEKLDSKGNLVEFELNPTWKKFDNKGNITMTFAEVWQNIKSKMYDAFSIAYIPIKTASQMLNGVKARMLERTNLINVALTGNPINPDADITSVMAKSLTYMKSREDKEARYRKKSFDKDGAHAHTSEAPLGEHTHAEIERIMNDRFDYVHERINDLTRPETDKADSMMVGKSKNGDTMTEEEEKKKAQAKGSEDGDAGDTKDNDDAGSGADDATKEGKALDLKIVEVKSILDETNKKLDALIETNKTLQAKSKEFETILAKANPASLGAEAKSAEKDGKAGADIKTAGPLDMI